MAQQAANRRPPNAIRNPTRPYTDDSDHDSTTLVGYWGVSHEIELLHMWHGTQGKVMHGPREEKEKLSTTAQIVAKGLKSSIGVPV